MLRLLYKINKDKIVYRIINKEAVLLNLESGVYYSLNKTGADIWQYINEGKCLDEILDSLEARHKINRQKLKRDLLALIKDLEREKLIAK